MGKKWQLVYRYIDEVFHQKEVGQWPGCLPAIWRGGRCYPDLEKRMTVADRPDDLIVLCENPCRRHLYWASVSLNPAIHDEIPIVVVEVYEKQEGKISEIDEHIALGDILDEDTEEFRNLLRSAEEATRKGTEVCEQAYKDAWLRGDYLTAGNAQQKKGDVLKELGRTREARAVYVKAIGLYMQVEPATEQSAFCLREVKKKALAL